MRRLATKKSARKAKDKVPDGCNVMWLMEIQGVELPLDEALSRIVQAAYRAGLTDGSNPAPKADKSIRQTIMKSSPKLRVILKPYRTLL